LKEEQPYLLAIECSGRVGSAALSRGDTLLGERVFSGTMRHSSELFSCLEDLLRQAGCSLEAVRAFCFSKGPGSFTGLRIAVTCAKMLHFAKGMPLISVNTLDVIANNAIEYIENQKARAPSYLAVVLDAKQKHFFSAIYRWEQGKWTKEIDDMLISYSDLVCNLHSFKDIAVSGEGLLYQRHLFLSEAIPLLPEAYWPARAKSVLELSYPKLLSRDFEDPVQLIPYYIRPPEITEKKRRQG
jgi:tRNA threonylcarbamoyladenosine biosynthesis protein TsaB